MTKVICFLLLTNLTWSATYYFSSISGLDTRTSTEAKNSATPWKSLKKLNEQMGLLQPGDSVLFKCNEIFYGSIIVAKSGTSSLPIVFSSFGSGAKPVITGLSTLTTWTNKGGNLWESASCDSCGVPPLKILAINGKPYGVGRYPNVDAAEKGYLYFEARDSNALQITDNELASTPNWTNGDVVIRTCHYVLDTKPIKSHSGNSINYTGKTTYTLEPGFGYFIQNHPLTLDKFGEWYYNPATMKVSLYGKAANPSTMNVQITTQDYLLKIENQNFITFENFSFKGSDYTSIIIEYSNSVSLIDCNIDMSGVTGISALITQSLKIENCYINNSNSTALKLFGRGSIIRNNTFKNSGSVAGMGESSIGPYRAITAEGNSNLFEFNTIDTTGYIPINFQGDTVTIKNNFINYFCFLLQDGGAIYTYNACPEKAGGIYGVMHYARKIIGNIVLNGVGANEGTNSTNYSAANGLYLDDNTMGVELSDNTVANCGLHGQMVHNSYDNIIQRNTYFNNGSQFMMQGNASDYGCSEKMKDNLISGNILFSKSSSQPVLELTADTLNKNVNLYGQFSGNVYSRLMNESNIVSVSEPGHWEQYGLTAWQTAYQNDLGSTSTPITISPFKVNSYVSSNKFSNSQFTTNLNSVNTWIDVTKGSYSIVWDNTGKLDGGCIKFTVTPNVGQNPQGLIYLGIGAVDSTKDYVLKFSSRGTKIGQNIQVMLRKTAANWNNITEIQDVPVSTSRTEHEILFTKPDSSFSQADIQFYVNGSDSTIYLDNIEFYEANVTLTNPDDYIRFEYNATKSVKNVSLIGSYVDMKGNSFTGSVSLQPYTSIILLKNNSIASEVANPANGFHISRFPNPAGNSIIISSNRIIDRLEFMNIRGQVVLSLAPGASAVKADIKSLTPGAYFMKSSFKKAWRIDKVVKSSD